MTETSLLILARKNYRPYDETLHRKEPKMVKPETTAVVNVDATEMTDGKKLAIKLALMTAVAVATTVASTIAQKQIEKKLG
jgi:hypothetical protein